MRIFDPLFNRRSLLRLPQRLRYQPYLPAGIAVVAPRLPRPVHSFVQPRISTYPVAHLPHGGNDGHVGVIKVGKLGLAVGTDEERLLDAMDFHIFFKVLQVDVSCYLYPKGTKNSADEEEIYPL